MELSIKELIENKNYEGLRRFLAENPRLANEGIEIPCNRGSGAKAHPLHRICDAIFSKRITDEEGIELATIFLEYGANINGEEKKDTPLVAAASLHAEKLGIFYIERGADIHYADRHDGATALHWAAYCGRDKLVERLIQCGAAIDQADRSYGATPVGWAVQPLTENDQSNTWHQVSCIKMLLAAGSVIEKFSRETAQYLEGLAKTDPEIKVLLSGAKK
jgi:uncharacterized protein